MSCPNCGGTSLAEITEHSCRKCAVIYMYCPACLIDDEIISEIWKEGINHEETRHD